MLKVACFVKSNMLRCLFKAKVDVIKIKGKFDLGEYMKIQNNIEKKLLSHFNPQHLDVINESAMHNVPAGSESHFKVVIVTPMFGGERLIKRHRAVNAILKEELANDIHALALHTYTQEEWHSLYGAFPTSPNCLGGGKKEQ